MKFLRLILLMCAVIGFAVAPAQANGLFKTSVRLNAFARGLSAAKYMRFMGTKSEDQLVKKTPYTQNAVGLERALETATKTEKAECSLKNKSIFCPAVRTTTRVVRPATAQRKTYIETTVEESCKRCGSFNSRGSFDPINEGEEIPPFTEETLKKDVENISIGGVPLTKTSPLTWLSALKTKVGERLWNPNVYRTITFKNPFKREPIMGFSCPHKNFICPAHVSTTGSINFVNISGGAKNASDISSKGVREVSCKRCGHTEKTDLNPSKEVALEAPTDFIDVEFIEQKSEDKK